MPRFRHELALCQINLGNLLRQAGRTDEAAQAYRQAVALLEKLAAGPSAGADYRLFLARSHINLALLLEENSRPQEAEQAYRQALALYEKLAAKSPDRLQCGNELALCLRNLGHLLRQTGRPDAAAQACRQAVAAAQQAVKLAPQAAGYWSTLGAAQYRAGEWHAVLRSLHRSRELGGEPEDGFYLAMAHGRLGEQDRARQWYDRACTALGKNQPADKQLLRLRAEAAALLGLPVPADPAGPGTSLPGKQALPAPGVPP
jgi:tetratricopeptide (TPR) repeat protein